MFKTNKKTQSICCKKKKKTQQDTFADVRLKSHFEAVLLETFPPSLKGNTERDTEESEGAVAVRQAAASP